MGFLALLSSFATMAILGTAVRAEPIPASAKTVNTRQEPDPTAYCCLPGCQSCYAITCNREACFIFPFNTCCAEAFRREVDNGSGPEVEIYNLNGQKMEFDEVVD